MSLLNCYTFEPSTYIRVTCNNLTKNIFYIRSVMIDLPNLISDLSQFSMNTIMDFLRSATHNHDNLTFDNSPFSTDGSLAMIRNIKVPNDSSFITSELKEQYISSMSHLLSTPGDIQSSMFVHSIISDILKCAQELESTVSYMYNTHFNKIKSDLTDMSDLNRTVLNIYNKKLDTIYEKFRILDIVFSRIYWSFNWGSKLVRSYYSHVQTLFWIMMGLSSHLNLAKENAPANYNELYIDRLIYDDRMGVNQMIINKFDRKTAILTYDEYQKYLKGPEEDYDYDE